MYISNICWLHGNFHSTTTNSHTPLLCKHYSLCTSHLLGLGCRTNRLRFCLIGRICLLCSSPWRGRGAINSRFCSHLKITTNINCLITLSGFNVHTGTATKPYSIYPQTLKNSQSRCHCKKISNILLAVNLTQAEP